ncbi:helicase-associated domain-containing protein [Cellulomonas sp. APG4]|uniref:helicase-associated domain-containing protein n=1 Tax=Cellulomonas sp. APG4 TaxID=1538656 RepID=UPI00137AF18C|nr:helicase-associated domain-containing protein [Cellulomonas sp. APG4]NCT92513.1 helicase-associated domain-containing protein [Cellulomonas sp. APG4]
MAGYTQALRARGEDALVALLRLRPDLAVPPPATLRSMAARATTRVSLDRALAGVDALVLQSVEAVLTLSGTAGRERPHVTAGEVAHTVGLAPEDASRPLRDACDLGLLWTDPDVDDDALLPAPGLDEALGPYAAGLGPSLRATLARRSTQGLARIAVAVGLPDDEPAPEDVAAALARPEQVHALVEQAPPGARQVLDALTWGPPVGRSPESRTADPAASSSPARTAVEWLLRAGLLAVQDSQHVVLPREVALALRDGRTHRAPALAPAGATPSTPQATADADATQHAQEVVRLVGTLVTAWGTEPAPVLRAGGLGTRELRRVAQRLEVPDDVAALVVEVAGAAGLVADDGEEQPAFAPTLEGEDWLTRELGDRWETLARAWLGAERAAWLVGSRDDRGSPRPALDPEARRPWAPRLRRSVLEVLAGTDATLAEVTAPPASHVRAVLAWRAPRSAPPEHAVEAVLAEAATLGVTGAGALGSAGRALLADAAPGPSAVLTGLLPAPVDDVLLQGDLTGIVPGRPSTALASLLEEACDVESRGAALTVRFTPSSVRRALDAGRTAEELLAELSRHARGGVPQPLEYLVLDVARRHGRLRAGMASAYLRSDDPALLAGLAEDPALRHLGLLLLAPTVLVAQATPAALVAVLRDRGHAPVTEDPSGRVVVAGPTRHVVRGTRRRATQAPEDLPPAAEARDRRLRRLAGDLLAASAPTPSDEVAPPGPAAPGAADAAGTADPVLALAILREAAAEGQEVWLEIADPRGGTVRRRVRPLRVDAGRVRAVDAEREAELTVAVHRITSVSPT